MWARKQICNQDIESLVRDARDYALLNGLVLRYPNITNDNCVAQIPITLFPSPFPRKLYQQCIDIQPIISILMLKIARDSAFMENSLSDVVKVDEFTKKLLDVNSAIQREGQSQSIISCINRSDYMMDKFIDDENRCNTRIRQVEVNAIASGMCSHSSNTKLMHDYLMSKYQIKTVDDTALANNDSIQLVAQALIEAFDSYEKQDSYILLVAEERSLNFSDHILTELEVHKLRPDVRFIRRRFIDLPDIMKLGSNKELLVDNNEIALVYFRYGYDPSNYNFSQAWDVRLLIERSRAIKCPSINFHLSGAKKFQQVLNNQEQLERFISTSDSIKLSRLFCKIWSLDANSPFNEDGYNEGPSSAKSLVLKPQREGGGHNIFGNDIRPFLLNLNNSEDRSQYILMEYINSPLEKNWLLLHDDNSILKNDTIKSNSHDKLISELGIYGSILASEGAIKSNRAGGYLIRSKKFGVNEGGVASGFAGLSSLLLINDDMNDKFDLNLFYEN